MIVGIKTTRRFTCDLCQDAEAEAPGDVNHPPGWVVVSHEDSRCDRTFHTRVICKDCVTKVLVASKALPFVQTSPDQPKIGGLICRNCGNTGTGFMGEPCTCKAQLQGR